MYEHDQTSQAQILKLGCCPFSNYRLMRPLIPLIVLLTGFGITSHPSRANSLNPEIIEACKDARDFQGCANSFQGVQTTHSQPSSSSEEECNDEGWCVAKAGIDIFGLPKVVGWEYKSTDNGIHYGSPKLYKIKHKGSSNRYLARKYVWHYYKEATPGTSGYYKTVSSGQRKCGYYPNGSYYCYTTKPEQVWVPGKPGKPGGSRVTQYTWVHDCKDNTHAYYYSGKLKGKWKKRDRAEACAGIEDLTKLSLKL